MPELGLDTLANGTEGRSVLWGDIRALMKLAFPIIGITLSRMLMGFADFYMVSFLGTSATAAISPATMFVFAFICLGAGAVTSVQTYTAQSVGRGRPREAASYVGQAMFISAGLIPLAAFLSFSSTTLWGWIGAPPDVQILQSSFCRIALWSVPFGAACGGLEGFFNGIQKPGVALRAISAALICVVVGNYLLIFGKFGFPKLGVPGAAVSTVIAWCVRLAILLFVYLSDEFNQRYGTRGSWRFDWPRLRAVFLLGGPTAIQWVLDIGAWFLFLSVIIQHLGTETLAASNIGLQYMNLAFMPAIGVGVALCSLVGHCIGAGLPDLAVRKTRAALLVCVSYMAFIGLMFILIPRPLIRVVSDDPAVMAAGVGVLAWGALFQIFDAYAIVYINALRGAGDTRGPAVMLVTLCWGIFLCGGYAVSRLAPQFRHHGPWMMCTIYITILGMGLWRRHARGKWRTISLFGASSGAFPVSPEPPVIDVTMPI